MIGCSGCAQPDGTVGHSYECHYDRALAEHLRSPQTNHSVPQEPVCHKHPDPVQSARHHDIVCLVLKTLLQNVPGADAAAQTTVNAATRTARVYADALYPEAK